jgi:uncharacterized oxidoreductase
MRLRLPVKKGFCMKLQGKTILITGGTSGIGFELARQLLERGNTVIITGRDSRKLEAARARLPGVHALECDTGDPSAIQALHTTVSTRFPALDVLVNNAGIMRNLRIDRARDLLDVTREIDINLSGPIRMVQQFLPQLKSRPGSAIVNVSSGLAFIPYAISPVYSAAKAGLHAFSLCLRAQLAGTGVAVIELAPPGTETKLFRGEFEAETKSMKPMEVSVLVKHAIAGIESGKLEIRPGLSNVLKAMSRIAPAFMFNQLLKSSLPKVAAAK